MSDRKSYTYRVVTSNGAGVWGEYGRCGDAKKAAPVIAERHSWYDGLFEIERVETLPGGGVRYWMRQRSKWVLWSAGVDAAVRQPDWGWQA